MPPWRKGQSGNPLGRINELTASNALRIAVSEKVKTGRNAGKTRLRVIAETVARKAAQGKPWAVGMVYDRLDGKAVQPVQQDININAGAMFADMLKALNAQRLAHAPQPQVIEHVVQVGADLGPAKPAANVLVHDAQADAHVHRWLEHKAQPAQDAGDIAAISPIT